jgi:Zn-dependent protease
MQDFNIAKLVMNLTALILGITIHEWAHAITADRLGDDTPRLQGRVTLWPLAHLDPLGSILMLVSMFAGRGLGWGKPVETNPNHYRINKRLGLALVTIAGPLSNLVIATVFALFLRSHLLPDEDPFTVWAVQIVWINVGLFLFNLLPIYPLDGSKLLAAALPTGVGDSFLQFMSQFGWLILFAVVMSGALGPIMRPAASSVFWFLVGD